MEPGTIDRLNALLLETPYNLLQPTSAQYTDFIQLAKYYLDPLAEDVTESQLERQKHQRNRRKRKRRLQDDGRVHAPLLRMKKVHVDGFGVDEIWQQTKRVLNAAADEVEHDLPIEDETEDDSDAPQIDPTAVDRLSQTRKRATNGKAVRFVDDGLEISEGSDEGSDMDDFASQEEDLDGEAANNGEHSDEDASLELDEETPPSDVSDEDPYGFEEGTSKARKNSTYISDKHGLNDGFFSIDDFNKSTSFLENQDARGDPDDGAASDEEDIDWDANPLSFPMPEQAIKAAKEQRAGPLKKGPEPEEDESDGSDGDDDDDEEDGPTFGDMDLDAPEGDSGGEDDIENAADDAMGMNGLGNTNNVFYADFFAPPPRKSGGKKQSKPQKDARKISHGAKTGIADGVATATNGVDGEHGDEEEREIERAMTAVQRDLFDDDDDDAAALSDEDSRGRSRSGAREGQSAGANLSTHEREQLKLREEIRRLEAENVAAKPWLLTGETVAPARPMNSLLEEDLDFERAGKPVPVITEEVSESIEELIKRRILARDFDEVVRRRAGPSDLAPRRSRKDMELDDTKPTRSLAEEYEQAHLRQTDPNYVDTRSEALKKTHREIEAQWQQISAQLDALSNWHFKPRPPTASLEIRTDVPTISMEEARPGGGQTDAGASALAPQEVYKPGDGDKAGALASSGKGAIIRTKGGTVVARQEDTRESKLRRRRREKERAKKAASNKVEAGSAIPGSKPGDKNAKDGGSVTRGKQTGDEKQVLAQLKKGNVKVIGKRDGAVQDLRGRKAAPVVTGPNGAKSSALSGGNFKL